MTLFMEGSTTPADKAGDRKPETMLNISKDQFNQVKRILESTYPREGCGVLTGRVLDGSKIVLQIRAADNQRDDTQNRYLIDPEVIRDLEKELRLESQDILGFFHSHPDVAAVPSDYDRNHAWPWFSYLIVSVQGGQSEEARSWVLHEDRSGFDEERLVITDSDSLAPGPNGDYLERGDE